MVDESDSDQDAPKTEVNDPLAPPTNWSSFHKSRDGWWRSIGAIVVSMCVTAGILIWGFGTPPGVSNLYSDPSSDEPYENARIEVDIPHGWVQRTHPYILTDDLDLDTLGETQISPENTPQSDPTGLTISHFDPQASASFHELRATDPKFAKATPQSVALVRTYGRRLPPIENPKFSTDTVGRRKAFAIDYALTSPSGKHQCTERQLDVNQAEIILRLCSPANAKAIPQEYRTLLTSIHWVPRENDTSPQSGISIDRPIEDVTVPLPDGWENTAEASAYTDRAFHPEDVSYSTRPTADAFTIRRFPTNLLGGEQGLYPMNTPIEVCSPQWKTMADTWNENGRQNWLEDRTIGGRNACGYSHQLKQIDFWFVSGKDGLWVFTVVSATHEDDKDRNAKDPDGKRHYLTPEEKAQARQLLDQVSWIDVSEVEKGQ